MTPVLLVTGFAVETSEDAAVGVNTSSMTSIWQLANSTVSAAEDRGGDALIVNSTEDEGPATRQV